MADILDPCAYLHAFDSDLVSWEYFWRDHYNWLKSCGYCLRARYHPDWIPSWIIRDDLVDYEQEDFWIDGADACNMDAVRMEDGIAVKLKLIHLREYIEEEKLLYKLDEDALATDPQNHCMPTFEILNVPGEEEDLRIVITPLLRDWDDPRFDTVGEVVSVIQQIFEGMNFMHTHGIAYCSTVRNNIKLDPWDMYPDGFHPSNHTVPSDWDIYGVAKHYTRTQCSPRYYLEISPTSLIYSTRHGATAASIDGVDGAVFEVQQDGCSTYFPFAEDVYSLADWVKKDIIDVFKDFDFLRPLAEEMTLNSHVHRPQMEDAIHRLDALIKGMSSSQLRSPAVYKSDHSLVRVYRAIGYWKRRLFFTATSTPPIPMPKTAIKSIDENDFKRITTIGLRCGVRLRQNVNVASRLQRSCSETISYWRLIIYCFKMYHYVLLGENGF